MMIAAIIQARMGSTRLPGKVLMDIGGVPSLKYQIDRVKRSNMLDKIVVATSINEKDDVIADFCDRNKIECFRGSEDDVLSRYYECAKKYNADTIVRLTADCPLSDPEIIDSAIRFYNDSAVDYAANTVPPKTSTFPDGSDVEVFGMKALQRANKEALLKSDREHVTFFFWKGNNGFKTAQLSRKEDWSKYRITVDYPEDLEVIKFIVEELRNSGSFGHLAEIIGIIEANPEIRSKNSKYYFGIGWNK